jgi:hypothetical protein
MARGSQDTVGFRLWPPVAVGAPLLVGWLVTARWGGPLGRHAGHLATRLG